MLGPSCPSCPIVSQNLGISWDVPLVLALALAVTLALLTLSKTRDWWIVPWDPKVPWNNRTGQKRGTKYVSQTCDWWDVPWDPKVPWNNRTEGLSMYPRPVTGGRFHGIPRFHGTIGRGGQERLSMYPRPVTGGRYQGLVECPMGSQGTMGQWDVLKSQWTFYSKAGQLRLIISRLSNNQLFYIK